MCNCPFLGGGFPEICIWNSSSNPILLKLLPRCRTPKCVAPGQENFLCQTPVNMPRNFSKPFDELKLPGHESMYMFKILFDFGHFSTLIAINATGIHQGMGI